MYVCAAVQENFLSPDSSDEERAVERGSHRLLDVLPEINGVSLGSWVYLTIHLILFEAKL